MADTSSVFYVPSVPGQLNLVDYKNSLAIIGDTKHWKENIKALGGRFNSSLSINDQKVAGWLFFDKNREIEISKFVQDVNSGQIKAMSPSVASNQNVNMGARARVAVGPRLQYQTITYSNVPLPYAGQGVTLTTNDSERMLVVQSILNNTPGKVDLITLKDGESIVTGAIVSGLWEILDFGSDHKLTFH